MQAFKIGLVGSSQLSFPGDKKGAFGRTSEKLAALAPELGFELYIYPQTVITADDGHQAARTLEAEKVDFVLLQCTSFSAGFLAPIFARVKNARLGLWAIPEMDTLPEGCVPFNSFCSINMYAGIIGHYLKDYEVPLKWFFGDVEDRLFIERFRITVATLKAIKQMQSSSVALIGGIAPGFDDLYDDERNLIRLFDGMRINRLHEYDEIKRLADAASAADVEKRMQEQIAESKGMLAHAKSKMEINARFSLAYERFIEKYGYDAIGVSCWPKFQDDYHFSVCAVVGELNDKGIPTACEGDLTSAISMLLLKYLSNDITTLMDLSAFDEKDDSVLLWHCGPTAKRFCQQQGYTLSGNYSGAPHEVPGHATGLGVARDMEFDPGKITIARLTGESDTMFLADASILPHGKPSYCGSRGWMGNIRLNGQPVGALDFINTLLVQRMQHHFPVVYGDYSAHIQELMAWLRLKPMEVVPYSAAMQNPTSWK